jgi:hypothetical protein
MTWIINEAAWDTDSRGRRELVVGLTTTEWIQISGDEERPGDALPTGARSRSHLETLSLLGVEL